MNRRFYREITTFFGKYTFNIHFFVLNVHFSILNIHFCNPNVHFLFVQKFTYMKVSIMKLIFLVQKQISEKRFQILCCFVNTFLQVRIVCTDKCVSEIPRIFRKNIIWYIVAQQLMWLMLITIAMGMCLMNGYSIFKEHGGQKKSPSLSLPLSEGLAHIIPKLFSIF